MQSRHTTHRWGWDQSVTVDTEKRYIRIHTRRDAMKFEGEDAFSLASRQADALADFYPGSGRFLVFNESEDDSRARVQYDEAQQRHGVPQDHDYEAKQHANSDTMSWQDARTFEV